jgi:hypothetical protein
LRSDLLYNLVRTAFGPCLAAVYTRVFSEAFLKNLLHLREHRTFFSPPKTDVKYKYATLLYYRLGALFLENQNVTCYGPSMTTTPKKAKPRTPQQRMASRRDRLRAQGLRPVQHWVPDLRDPRILTEIRRESVMLSRHPENAAIDDWLDTVRDPEDWS